MNDSTKWLSVKDIATLAGIKPSDFRTRVSRGYAPAPDDDDSERTDKEGSVCTIPANRRDPRWRADGAICDWLARHEKRKRAPDLAS